MKAYFYYLFHIYIYRVVLCFISKDCHQRHDVFADLFPIIKPLQIMSIDFVKVTTICILSSFLMTYCTVGNKQQKKDDKNNVKKVMVPLGGNTFQTGPDNRDNISGKGIITWHKPSSIFSTFVKFSEATEVDIALRASNPAGLSKVGVSYGKKSYQVNIDSDTSGIIPVGSVKIKEAGYARFDLQGLQKEGESYGEVQGLVLKVPENVELRYVRNNENNNFYWGRRGPSVHLKYALPEGEDIQWFYSEITVPEGEDPVGTYFMANGFGEGYFGMQVNSESERRILFSVWSPYQTDNPDEIPEDERIQLLKKGNNVKAGKFGNEGSGGQSYWVYPWEAGTTQRFLNGVRPDGKGNTIYTAYFYLPDEGRWKLIARFKRPKTDTWFTNAHSFLESFVPSNGYKGRRAWYHNQWARDKDGQWYEIKQATFTGDAIAQSKYRTDFAGGVRDGRFFLRNGGFFDEQVPLSTDFSQTSKAAKPPIIDFDALP